MDGLLEVRSDLCGARLAVFLASARTKGRAMRPLDPAVLIAVELLRVGAEVAGVGLFSRHDGVWERLGAGVFWR